MTERSPAQGRTRQGLPPSLSGTREAWHRLAEHVVSPARHAVTGRIGLRPAAGGFRTPPFGNATIVAVDLTDIVVTTGGGPARRAPITTLRQAASFVGVEPGAPADVYTPSTPLELDAPLRVDPEAARVLADWFALGAEALHRFADDLAERADEAASDELPSEAQLWPEHFDLAITAGRVGYGFSPGDQYVPVPYAYVSPHDPSPPGDDYFTEPFGAARTIDQVRSTDDAVAFLREGRARARRIPTQRSGSPRA